MSLSTALAIPDLSERRLEPELMDSPTLDRGRHLHALDALGRVNHLSLSAGRVWKEVLQLAREGVSPVGVLDVACGGGDVLVEVARRAAEAGVAVQCLGCDLSPVALERARSHGGDRFGVELGRLDVLSEPLPMGYDIVCSTLFLHHLARGLAVRLLDAMASATRRVLLVQDLRRSRIGYVLARTALATLTRSDVARRDGPVSVAAAWTVAEVEAMCRDAGLEGASVRACWPQRFLLRWART